jgi:hypothetical protein
MAVMAVDCCKTDGLQFFFEAEGFTQRHHFCNFICESFGSEKYLGTIFSFNLLFFHSYLRIPTNLPQPNESIWLLHGHAGVNVFDTIY